MVTEKSACETERERDRDERLMPRLGITVSFYKLNNYIQELRFQSDDYWLTSTYCMIACRLLYTFLDAQI